MTESVLGQFTETVDEHRPARKMAGVSLFLSSMPSWRRVEDSRSIGGDERGEVETLMLAAAVHVSDHRTLAASP